MMTNDDFLRVIKESFANSTPRKWQRVDNIAR